MARDRILAIEDDEGVCRLLRHSLAREDYQVSIVHSGEDGLAAAMDEPPDLFLLDLELPGMDGLEVCQELKNNPRTRSVPVIILTGKGEEVDVVQGLEMGADDYIVKPFSPKILNARLQAVLRRRVSFDSSPLQEEILNVGSLSIDTARNSVTITGNELDLSPAEYRFVLYLTCYLSGEDLGKSCPQMAEDDNPASVIGREGMALYSENRLGRLLPVFEGLTDSGHQNPAVLLEFYGLALLEKEPQKAGQLLFQAEKKFQEDNDPVGELVALSHLIFFHVVFDGNEKLGLRYLEQAETLNRAFFDRLSVFSRVAVAQNIAIGRSFLLNDFDGADEYLSIAEALAEDRGLINLVVLNRMVAIAEAYAKGDHEAMVSGLEESLRFVNHPQVSLLHKSFLKTLQIKYFSLVGDFIYLQLQEKRLREEYRQQLANDGIASSHLLLCRIEGLLFQQLHEEALGLCVEGLQNPQIVANDLIRPSLNGFMALAAALCNDKKIFAAATKACRAESGKMTFQNAQARLFCARALALSGQEEEAEVTLADVLPIIRGQGWRNLEFQARAQRLLLPIVPDESIGTLLAEMEEEGVWYLQTMVQDDSLRIFQRAVAAASGEAYARDIVRKRLMVAIDADGEPGPYLRISTLGGLNLHLGDELIARTDEFSRTQRELLALLAAMPDHRISQEEVQLTFWPDKAPDKARSTLDTMLSRLRQILKVKFQPYPVKKFLKLQKGILSLENVLIDSVDVVRDINQAREMVRRRDFWQADIAFAKALSRWQGGFMPGSCAADQSATYSRKLQQLCIEASLEWSQLLNETGQTGRSIQALAHALSMDRGNEALMKALYRSHKRDGNIAKAHQLLQQYEDVFKAEGYNASEAARIVASFKTSRES